MDNISSDPLQMNKELQQFKIKLLDSEKALQNKRKELDRFSHIISHDLKAPLSQIKLIAHLLKKKLSIESLNKEAQQLLEMLAVSVTQMADLIDSIHAYSKSGEFEHNVTTFSLTALLNKIISEIKASGNIKWHFPDKELQITTYQSQLSQVLLQLFNNAVQYNHLPEGNVALCFYELEDTYVFEVIDDGPGIPDEYQEKIFQIFNKGVKRANGRAGVGLSIAHNLVESAGGVLTLESKVGFGSKFRFTWPKI